MTGAHLYGFWGQDGQLEHIFCSPRPSTAPEIRTDKNNCNVRKEDPMVKFVIVICSNDTDSDTLEGLRQAADAAGCNTITAQEEEESHLLLSALADDCIGMIFIGDTAVTPAFARAMYTMKPIVTMNSTQGSLGLADLTKERNPELVVAMEMLQPLDTLTASNPQRAIAMIFDEISVLERGRQVIDEIFYENAFDLATKPNRSATESRAA
jgi:hypothetical protein